MATIVSQDSLEVVRISPISDQVKRLQIITCDVCNANKASFDVFVNGIISDVSVLKRCCNECVKSFNQ